MLRRPLEAAHVLGKLLTALGPERIVWGTDSTWYGSPQPLIDTFRAFQIPERLQAEPAIRPSPRTRRNASSAPTHRRLYGVSDDALGQRRPRMHDRAWVTNASAD